MDIQKDASVDMVAEALHSLGEQMSYMYDRNLLKQFRFSERLKLKCCKCQIVMMYHPGKVVDHPFFLTNLEHLEWASERKETV
jgi:hypothetical protein